MSDGPKVPRYDNGPVSFDTLIYEAEREAQRSTNTGNPKDAYGDAKTQFGLVPMPESVARVMTLGAKKYGAYNFRNAKIRNMVYAHAILRHLRAWMDGQDVDPESGESHMAHIASCGLIHEDGREHGNVIEERTWVVPK